MDEEVRKELDMNGIVLLEESTEVIEKLPDKDAGALIKAIIKGNGEGLPKMAAIVFPIIMGQVERMRALSDKNRENGKKGGRPKQNPNETQIKPNENPNETQIKPTQKPQHQYHTNTNIYTRNPKIQRAYGFSTERTDVDYNEIARRMREEREATE